MSAAVIFLGGIPGAGKSTLGRQLQNAFPGLLHLSAGELLAAELEPQVFRQLGVARLALLDARLAQIAHRLRMRGATPWWDGNFTHLRSIYRAEAAHARAVARTLGVELVEVPAGLPSEKASSLLGIPA